VCHFHSLDVTNINQKDVKKDVTSINQKDNSQKNEGWEELEVERHGVKT
jgi:hypothetical protein